MNKVIILLCGRQLVAVGSSIVFVGTYGGFLFWMCDCTTVKEILEYFGPVHQLRRWSQKLMGYEYAFTHWLAKMMKDIDALSRHFGKNEAAYLVQAVHMRRHDLVERPAAYSFDYVTITPRS